MTGGIRDRITREERLEARWRKWRRELLCWTQSSWLYRVLLACILPSFMPSAQSGIMRRMGTIWLRGEVEVLGVGEQSVVNLNNLRGELAGDNLGGGFRKGVGGGVGFLIWGSYLEERGL